MGRADRVLRALAHPKRREAIRYLQGHEADSLSAHALNRAVFDGSDSSLADLHHLHLPKLDEAGLVEYDARTKTISLEDGPAYVTTVISALESVDA